jgi:hypothetical protein
VIRKLIALISIVIFSLGVIICEMKAQESRSPNISGSAFGLTGFYGEKPYQLANNLGARWIRPEIKWGWIEPQKNQFNWVKLDKLYEDFGKKYGFNIMISLRTGQLGWATRCDKKLCRYKKDIKTRGCPDKYASLPPKDLESTWNDKWGYSKDYYEFIFKLVEHFKGKINYLVIENEVNTLTFWHGTKEEYLQLRATAYKAAHDANPEVVVIDNGIAGGVWDYAIIWELYHRGKKEEAEKFFRISAKRTLTQEKINKNIGNADKMIKKQRLSRDYEILKAVFKEPTFDVASYHLYGPWECQKIIIDWLKSEMRKNGYEKPIICTEGGFVDSLRSPEDAQVQQEVAEDIIKLHVTAFGENVKKWIWLPLVEKYEGKAINLRYKGLYNSTLKKLPAGIAYEIMIKKIDNFSSVEKLDFGPEIYAYKFIVAEKPMFILWSKSEQKVDLSKYLTGKVKVTDIKGDISSVESFTINSTSSPIFVEE